MLLDNNSLKMSYLMKNKKQITLLRAQGKPDNYVLAFTFIIMDNIKSKYTVVQKQIMKHIPYRK